MDGTLYSVQPTNHRSEGLSYVAVAVLGRLGFIELNREHKLSNREDGDQLKGDTLEAPRNLFRYPPSN
jgi:hypothetical protein